MLSPCRHRSVTVGDDLGGGNADSRLLPATTRTAQRQEGFRAILMLPLTAKRTVSTEATGVQGATGGALDGAVQPPMSA